MGITFLLIIVTLEVALMTYSLITKMHRERARGIVHLLAFVVFSMLALA